MSFINYSCLDFIVGSISLLKFSRVTFCEGKGDGPLRMVGLITLVSCTQVLSGVR